MSVDVSQPLPRVSVNVHPPARRVVTLPPIIGGKVIDGPCDDVMATTAGASIRTRFPSEHDVQLIESGKQLLGPQLRALSLRAMAAASLADSA